MNCPRCNSDKIIFLYPSTCPGISAYRCMFCGKLFFVKGEI